MEAAVKNAADREQVREAEKKSRRILARDQNDLRVLLEMPEFRRVAWKYLTLCGVYRSSFVGEFPNTNAFNEGRRDVGLNILAEIMQVNEKAFITMMTEAKNREENNE